MQGCKTTQNFLDKLQSIISNYCDEEIDEDEEESENIQAT